MTQIPRPILLLFLLLTTPFLSASVYTSITSNAHYNGIESDIYFYHGDHLGSASWITEHHGAPIQYIHYLPYGEILANQKASTYNERFKFTGKELDAESGYYYYGARYLLSELGDFLSVDPLSDKAPSIQPYLYCNGNPIKYVDPDGQNPVYDIDGNFLGTDNTGLQGYYYVMDKTHFTQGMSHFDAGSYALLGPLSDDVQAKIDAHYSGLPARPDYDGFVTIREGVGWAKSHPGALQNPTPDNMLYIDASKLDFGVLSTAEFPQEGVATPKNLFTDENIKASILNPTLMATVYALGCVNMILTDRAQGTVMIVNDNAVYYDWNLGGGSQRDTYIRVNNALFNINPKIHGFIPYYYGTGTLRR